MWGKLKSPQSRKEQGLVEDRRCSMDKVRDSSTGTEKFGILPQQVI